MVDLIVARLGKLTRMSRHYRELAAALVPEELSAEIAEVAEAVDGIVERMNRECLGRRTCPCEFSSSCIALPDDAAPLQVVVGPEMPGNRPGSEAVGPSSPCN
jgi:hypothetical protein